MRRVGMGGLMLMSVLVVVPPGFADQGGRPGSTIQKRVSGVISKVQSGMILVETPAGQVTVSSHSGPGDLKVGEKVEMQMNEHDVVVEVYRMRVEKAPMQGSRNRPDSQEVGREAGKTRDPGLIF